MDFFMNIDQIPAGQALYTLALTDAPVGTPQDELGYDEVDFRCSTRLMAHEVARRAQQAGALEGYEGCRVIGVSNQSDGYVMWQDPHGNLLS